MESLLREAGIKEEELAIALDVAHNTVRNWVAGRTVPNLDPEKYVVLLETLNCTASDLAQAVRHAQANKQKRKPGRKSKSASVS